MRSRYAASVLLGLVACSFPHGKVPMLGDNEPVHDGAIDVPALPDAQPIDAPMLDAFVPATNLVAASAGATFVAFSSEYCPPNNAPGNCQTGYWNHANITDGAYAIGDNSTAYRAAWSSSLRQDSQPENFELAFLDARSATIDRFVIQNWGRGNGGTLYYSTHVRIYGRTPASSTWTMLVDADLATNEMVQTFMLASPVLIDRVRLSITAGMRSDYWELGEFEAWGWLE